MHAITCLIPLVYQVTSIIDFVTSVVAFSADIQQEHELYTVEDGLSLWLATLRNLPAPHPPLQALFPQVQAHVLRFKGIVRPCSDVVNSLM